MTINIADIIGQSTFHSWGWPKARIYHKCTKCKGTVSVGQPYARLRVYRPILGLAIRWSTYKFCAACTRSHSSIHPTLKIERVTPSSYIDTRMTPYEPTDGITSGGLEMGDYGDD